jgi:hypothetical protein
VRPVRSTCFHQIHDRVPKRRWNFLRPVARCAKMRGPAGLRSPSRHRIKRSILRLPTALDSELLETGTSMRRLFLGSSESSKALDPADEAKASLGSLSINLSIKSTILDVADALD